VRKEKEKEKRECFDLHESFIGLLANLARFLKETTQIEHASLHRHISEEGTIHSLVNRHNVGVITDALLLIPERCLKTKKRQRFCVSYC
jgi:hypothetical protein